MSYDPSIGRWLEVDPSEFEAGDNNLYRFVGNDPITYVDPTGLGRGQNPPGKSIAIHGKYRPDDADILWKIAGNIDKNIWDVDGSKGAKEALEAMKDGSIRNLYLNTHAGGNLTADLLTDPDYQDLIKKKLTKGGTIYVYSCGQGLHEDQRKKYQEIADRIGCVITAPTGRSTTPFKGVGFVNEGEWIRYIPGKDVPYKGQGRLEDPPKYFAEPGKKNQKQK